MSLSTSLRTGVGLPLAAPRPTLSPAPDALATVLEYSALAPTELTERIRARKSELGAVILGHNYQRVEIQGVSDYLGDSLGLAQEAAATDAEVIVFCGVHFMAETAKILSPDRPVLMPDLRAGCPMADFATAEAVRRLKSEHPGAAVVAYVNSTAAVKAEADICCTSANAVEIVESFPADQAILFVPDRNLARYVADRTGRSNIVAWDGYCYVHDDLVLEELEKARRAHPDALVVVHPEARPDLLRAADVVTSTSGMVRMAEEHRSMILGTERGLVEQLRVRYPDGTFVPLSGAAVCGNMKLNTLARLAWSLDHGEFEVRLDEGVRRRAEASLRAMLEQSGGWARRDPTPEEEALEYGSARPRGCGCA